LRSRKGLNLPNIDLGIRAFTEHDRAKPGTFAEEETKRVAAAMSQAGLRHHHAAVARVDAGVGSEQLAPILTLSGLSRSGLLCGPGKPRQYHHRWGQAPGRGGWRIGSTRLSCELPVYP
jgi:hypothetical protein